MLSQSLIDAEQSIGTQKDENTTLLIAALRKSIVTQKTTNDSCIPNAWSSCVKKTSQKKKVGDQK